MTLESLIEHIERHLKRQGHQLDMFVTPETRGYNITLRAPDDPLQASRFYTELDIQNAQPATVATQVNHLVASITQQIVDERVGSGVINVRA